MRNTSTEKSGQGKRSTTWPQAASGNRNSVNDCKSIRTWTLTTTPLVVAATAMALRTNRIESTISYDEQDETQVTGRPQEGTLYLYEI